MKKPEFIIQNSLGYLIGRTRRALAGRMNIVFAEAGHDVTIEQWIVLTVLVNEDGQCQQRLADIIGIDKTSMTRMLHGLQKKKLIRRASDKRDLRYNKIYITASGRSLHLSLMPLVEKTQTDVTDNIPAADLAACLQVLKYIFENTKHDLNCK